MSKFTAVNRDFFQQIKGYVKFTLKMQEQQHICIRYVRTCGSKTINKLFSRSLTEYFYSTYKGMIMEDRYISLHAHTRLLPNE